MKTCTEQDYHERIVRTLVYIQEHLDEELELGGVAAVAAFSSFHFHRIFRALVGEPFGEHVRRLRLERAAQRLKRLDEPVTQVALDAGFETHEAFTRAFRTMFGVSPSNYRTANRPTADADSGTHSRGNTRKTEPRREQKDGEFLASLGAAPGPVRFGSTSGYRAPDYGEPPAVELKELAPMQIVFLRHVGPYHKVGPTWGRLMSWAGSRGLLGPQMKMIGIVHDDPDVTPPDKIRYDAAIVVTRAVQPEGEFGILELQGGLYAVLMHRGPYEQIGQTYQRLYGGWLPKSGREVRDAPAFEQYLNSPMNTRPEDLLTRIHVPVE